MRNLVTPIVMLHLLTGSTLAQNPPPAGDPYAPRGNATSPDHKYEWMVQTSAPIRYELIDTSTRRPLITVKAYYPEANPANIQYAKANGVFWNPEGTVVALDELNRRRAGHLYFFTLLNGKLSEIRSETLIPIPAWADEGRVVVDPGWISGTRIRVRLALKTRGGDFVTRLYLIDFSRPERPEVEAAN